MKLNKDPSSEKNLSKVGSSFRENTALDQDHQYQLITEGGSNLLVPNAGVCGNVSYLWF